MAQPALWGSLGLAGATVGAAGQEGVCRTYSVELIPKLVVGPLPAHQHLCPPDLVLQHWRSLGALKFVMVLRGRLGTAGLGGDGSWRVVRWRKGTCWTRWGGRAWDGTSRLAGPFRGAETT